MLPVIVWPYLCEPAAQQCKSPALLPLQTSMTSLPRLKSLTRASLCHGCFSPLPLLMRTRLLSFSFSSLYLHWPQRAFPAPFDVLYRRLLVAAGLQTTLLSCLCIEELSLSPALPPGHFQLLWSEVASVASKFRAWILESCVRLPGVEGFALYAAEHSSAPWLLANGQGAAQTPSPWKGALPKMSSGKHFCT